MPLHLDEFQREEFQGYVESVPPKRNYALASLFPDKDVFDTEFAYNVISGGYGQMASITAWDAGAPLRDKDTLARMTGELGKVQHGHRLTEKELLMYNRPRMDAEQKQAIDSVYDNTDKLVWGVYDREEWLRAQATYKGALTVTENDVVLDIDFLIPEENKLAMADDWSESTADIIGALQAGVNQFKDANDGESPSGLHMNRRVASYILKNEGIKTQIYGQNDTRVVTNEQVNSLFTSLGIPNFTVITDRVRGDNGMEDLMPEDRVVFVGEQLGRTLKGPTVEKNYQPGIYVIPEIRETNPPRQEVFVGETCFPALERPSAIVHMIVSA